MLPRTLEPEVMDAAQEAADYDSMDHSEVNRVFVDDLLAFVSGADAFGMTAKRDVNEEALRVLDVGTGTALIPIELGRRDAGLHVTAIDLAEEMLAIGRRNVAAAKLADVIDLEKVDAKQLPYADGTFDVVMSNSIVHHIPEPRGSLEEMVRVLSPGGVLFVRDLMRPETSAEVERLVQIYAGQENERQQQLFRQSLHAALTVEEVAALLAEVGLPGDWVRASSDRHWTIAGVKP